MPETARTKTADLSKHSWVAKQTPAPSLGSANSIRRVFDDLRILPLPTPHTDAPLGPRTLPTQFAYCLVHSRGFSLIELLMVMTVISAVSAIAIPRYANSLARYRVEVATQRIVADLAYARTQAQVASKSEVVNFDVATDTYNLPNLASLDDPLASYTVNLNIAPYHCTLVSALFDDPSNPSDDVTEVTFDGYGTPDSNGNIQVTCGGITMTVVLNGDTGNATVQ